MQGESGGMAPGAVSLSELLAAVELGGRTWCYSDIGTSGGFSVPPADAAFFHAALHGAVRITCAGGGTIELKQGEAVFVLSGEAHAVRVVSDSTTATLDFLREDRSTDTPPTFPLGVTGPGPLGAAGPVAARVLSGRLTMNLPAGSNRSSLPSFLQIGAATQAGWGALLRPEALPLAGMGPGSAALLTRLAALMLVAHLRTDPACRRMFSPEKPDPIAQALRLVAGNPSANWTVERLARSVGMGRSNFAAHFTAQVGRAPMEVVAERRMEQAAQLLRKGSLKIAEISELAGYGSEAAFSRRFTRHFGMSPSQLRDVARTSDQQGEPAPSWQPLLAGARLADGAARGGAQSAAVESLTGQMAAPAKLRSVILRSRDS